MDNYVEEQEIDILDLLKTLWDKKKTIGMICIVFTVLGLIAALATEHRYTTCIAFVPQSNSSVSNKLSSIASMAGISLDDGSNDGPISAVAYPKVMDNLDMMKELAYTPIHFKGYREPIRLIDWFNDEQYAKKSFFATLKKYTIGLPGLLSSALSSSDEEEISSDDEAFNTPSLTKEEAGAIKFLKNALNLKIVKNEKHVILSATMNESRASAELADASYELFKSYISEFKITKARSNLEYLEKQYAKAKADYEEKQLAYAQYKDRNQGKHTAAAEVELQRLNTEMELARMLYMELSKNCLAARVKVTEETVSFTKLVPAYVPLKSVNSRKSILLFWILAGFALSCAYVLIKEAIDNKKNE